MMSLSAVSMSTASFTRKDMGMCVKIPAVNLRGSAGAPWPWYLVVGGGLAVVADGADLSGGVALWAFFFAFHLFVFTENKSGNSLLRLMTKECPRNCRNQLLRSAASLGSHNGGAISALARGR